MRRTTAPQRAIAAVIITAGALFLATMGDAQAAAPSLSDTTLANPNISGNVASLTRGHMGEQGDVSAFVYYQTFGTRPWAAFRDASTGATSHVALAAGSVAINEWQDASVVLTGNGRLWVLSGTGPVFVRELQLAGSPLPTSATLVRTSTFGDADSRPGDLIQLASGAIAAVWHQQGDAGPEGYGIAHLKSGASTWTQRYPVQFMPSWASKQVMVQHPADGSVWVFSDPDAWGRIGVIHLTETSAGLGVDWTDGSYLAPGMGAAAPDPENPWLAAAADPATGTIALAYQSADRQIFSTSPVVTGSKPVVTRIGTSAVTSTVVLPTYVERISSIGLSIQGTSTWLTYRPIDQATMTFKDLYVSRHDGSTWQAPVRLGTLANDYERIAYTADGAEFVARMSDGKLHSFAPPAGGTTSTTVSPTSTSSTSTTAAPAPTTKTSKPKGGGGRR